MKTIRLNGTWKLYFAQEAGEMPSCMEEVRSKGWRQIEALVPGNIELDLCRAGIEEDPFIKENIYNFRKYEFYQWWFEREFHLPEDFFEADTFLVLKGLDTFGTLWINGIKVASTDNMLMEYEADVSEAVRPGKNHVAVRIESTMNRVRNREFPVAIRGAGWENNDEMAWVRKPGHSFGWDIAPRLLSAGIWRDIELVTRNKTRIKEVYYTTLEVRESAARLLVKYRFSTDAPTLDGFSVRIKGKCEESEFEILQKARFCAGEAWLWIKDAHLWWPAAYGKASLYDVTFELLHEGRVADTRKDRVGLRQVRMDVSFRPGDEGEFKVNVNGTPVLCKGSNWVPLDALHSRDAGRLKAAHDMLQELGCNIVRCWGGNVYEDHAFYDLCDERGIMVWQDFSFACAIYPQCDEFAAMAEKEAEFIIRKLRNHPSILLWAGDNEVDAMYYHFGYHMRHARYNRISREILPRAAASHDPFRYFLPSSPYIPENITGDLNVPEQHNWGPRDYFKGDFYRHTTAHFISEIGYHGCPSVTSVKKFISEEKLWPFEGNDEWDTHNTEYLLGERRDYNRNALMAKQVAILFGFVPENLEEFALASQISQAEAKKFFIEMVRLKKWRRTGLIWWNLLDCWPQFSDAIVDYYYCKKLAYHYIYRVQRPICIMMSEPENWEHKLVLGNDGGKDALMAYRVEDGETGEILLKGTAASKANENIELGVLKALPGEKRLYLIKWEAEGISYGNHYISGYVPLDFETYKGWLQKIQALPDPFDAKECYQ